MIKKSNILNIVKEDILRVLAEKKKKVLLDSIKAEIKVSSFFMSKALKKLEKEGLIRTEGNFIK
jgi:Mn-dependent DtxR family transcriptional regulator